MVAFHEQASWYNTKGMDDGKGNEEVTQEVPTDVLEENDGEVGNRNDVPLILDVEEALDAIYDVYNESNKAFYDIKKDVNVKNKSFI